MKRGNLIALFVALALICSCRSDQKAQYIKNEGGIFGTWYHVSYEHPKGENIHDEILEDLKRLDMSLSTYKEESVLSKVNKNEDVKIDGYFSEVYKKAIQISKITNGAFDPTVAPLVNAWGFGFTKKEDITPWKIDSIKQFVGYQKIQLQSGRIIKEDARLMLDFSAIAKGFAVDKIADLLRKKGCENYMVEIGGEVVAKGVNEKGRIWRIGINEPNDNEPAVVSRFQAIVSLKDKAVATSGNYRNFYVENGKKFAHTINPATGYPVDHSLLSATVVADKCMSADAFATALMVMGVEKAMQLMEKQDSLEIFLIYADDEGENQLLMTRGFQDFIAK